MVIAEDLLNEYLYSVFGSKKSHVHSFPSLLQPAWAVLVLCKRGAGAATLRGASKRSAARLRFSYGYTSKGL